jgi:diadenosine tetraphosphatase ApaH/serine/threonine PP2A family protein phosphatase
MLAVLYDLHGNLPALEAVLADSRGAGAERYLLGGDYAAFGAWPVETVAACEALGESARWIRGNWERWLGGDADDMPDRDVVRGARAFTLDALDAATVQRHVALPAGAVVDGTLYCHASPVSDMASFLPEAQDGEEALLGGAEHPARIVFGHTHLQFQRERPDGTTLVNPGSVGLPLDGDVRAAYALVDDSGGLELRRVAYDHGSVVQALRARREAWADAIAGWVERASPE